MYISYPHYVLQPSQLSSSRTFSPPQKETLYLVNSHSSLLPHPSQPPANTDQLSISTDLPSLDISYTQIINVTFCDWLLSLSMFSKFTHIIACVSLLHLLLLVNIPWHGHNTVGLSIHLLIDILIIFTFWLIGAKWNISPQVIKICTTSVTERVQGGPAAHRSKAKKQARLVESLLYFRCWQLGVGAEMGREGGGRLSKGWLPSLPWQSVGQELLQTEGRGHMQKQHSQLLHIGH